MMRIAAVAALVAVFVYANSLPNDFALDDVVVVQENELVRSGSVAEIVASPYWPEAHASRARPEVTYRPATMLSYRLQHAVTGSGPLGFHVVNVLLHAGVSALVVLLAGAVGAGGNGAGRIGVARMGAAVAGLVFAAHPVHAEAVAGIVGRAELLAAAGWIGALVVHLRRPRGAPLFVFLLGLVACGAKEPAVTLPAAVLLLAWYRGTVRRSETVADVVAAAGAVAVVLAARSAVLGAAFAPGAEEAYWAGGDAGVRIATAFAAVTKYAQLAVFPWRLSADYSFDQFPLAAGLLDARAALGLLLLAACAVGASLPLVRCGTQARQSADGRRVPLVAAGLGLFLVPFAPVSGLLFPLNVILAERLLYLPSAGLCIALGALLGPRLEGLGRGWSRGALVAAFALLLLGARTVARNPVWANDAVLFEHTVRDAPRSAKAWAGLGQARAGQGRADDAVAAYERALSIAPESYAGLDGLGHLALERGDLAEALARFQEAARVRPAEPAPWHNAGVVHLQAGRPDRAIQALDAALRIDPAHRISVTALEMAWQNVAVAQASAGDLDAAEETLTRGIERIGALAGDVSQLEAMRDEVRAAHIQ